MNLVKVLACTVWLACSAKADIASWYGHECSGKLMANGKPFNPYALTCASWDYPLGTVLRVSHGDKTVRVVVTDRGPAKRLYRQGRKIDLSWKAFATLADPRVGLIEVNIRKENTNKK